MLIVKIILAIFLFGMIIMIHEFGHYLAARIMGVRVNEFAIGMGPKVFKFRKGETLYSIRALPIGGFCAMEGEDDEAPTPSAMGGNADRDEEPTNAERSFQNKKVWQRIIIVVAGAVMNLLLGFILLLIYNGFLQKPYNDKGTVLFPTTTIAEINESTSAYQSGLRAGDTVKSINGRRILMDSDMIMEMQNDADGILSMTVERIVDGKKQTVSLNAVQFQLNTDPETGRNYLVYDFVVYGQQRTVLTTITHSAKQEVSIATIVWRSLVDMVRGRYGLNDLSGPVGTVDVIADAVGEANTLIGLQSLFMLMIMITINLGVFNLLPLPALDGGRLMFLVWEGVTRRPVPAKYEGIVHFVGLILLLLLMVVIAYSDITKLFI